MKNPSRPTVGILVRILRQAGMSREQLALETGLPLAFVEQLEDGRLPPLPWIVRQLMKSGALRRLPHLASEFQIPPLDLGDLTVEDALGRYATRSTGGTKFARRLRPYFAPSTLAKALGDLAASDLAASARTVEPVIAFLDWCTARGWLPSNPLRANGAHGRHKP